MLPKSRVTYYSVSRFSFLHARLFLEAILLLVACAIALVVWCIKVAKLRYQNIIITSERSEPF